MPFDAVPEMKTFPKPVVVMLEDGERKTAVESEPVPHAVPSMFTDPLLVEMQAPVLKMNP